MRSKYAGTYLNFKLYAFLLGLLQLGSTFSAKAQVSDLNGVIGVCGVHEVRFGADLHAFPGLKNIRLSPDEQLNQMRLPYVVLLGALQSLGGDAIPAFFETYKTVVGAADDFRGLSTGALGMGDTTSVYIAVPQGEGHDTFRQYLERAARTIEDGRNVFSWRLVSEDEHEMYEAIRLTDGTLIISNQKIALKGALKELVHEDKQNCSAPVRELATKPYWLFREARKDRSMPLGDAGLQQEIEWASLTIDTSRQSVVELHRKGKADRPAPELGGVPFVAGSLDYILTVTSQSKVGQSFWASVLGLFGFDVFS